MNRQGRSSLSPAVSYLVKRVYTMKSRRGWPSFVGVCLVSVGCMTGVVSINSTVHAFAAWDATPTAKVDDVIVAKKRLDAIGSTAKLTMDGTRLTEIVIQDGSRLTSEDLALFGRLTDLTKLQIFNCRAINTEMASKLNGLNELTTLALTNTVIDDLAVDALVKSFPKLTELACPPMRTCQAKC